MPKNRKEKKKILNYPYFIKKCCDMINDMINDMIKI